MKQHCAITNNTNWPTNLPTMNLTGTNNWYKFTLPNDSKALGCLFIFGTSQTTDFTGINADTWIEFNTDNSLKSNSNTAPILAPTTMFTLSVAETDSTINKDETLIIYPNPATNLLNIYYTAAGTRQIEVTIFDVRGNLVYTKKEHTKNGFNQELSLLGLNLKSGAYFLTIASSKSKMTKTFVVNE